MQNHKCALFIAAGLSAAAYAETPPPQLPVMEEYTLQRLEQIQAETVMLEAKAARARIQRELEDSGIDARTAPLPLNGRELAMLPRAGGLPSVEEIYGSGKQLMARLVLSDGKRAELRQGEQIPGTRLRVETISAREVWVADGNDKRTLAFY
ncbi:type IV pilus biogenesis protein PilP [Arsenophonus nasoniae]|uniref:Type IV pilus biogenesis protein PilP n=1 Tax=Arsenophonus nasoniae TaxID=638 RepID=A0AA95KBY8_9GAMM|nr:type IV pilus biogenesis protein PilP [Arsenophonus nasoniae]WGM03696.1 type IV pilus biogenesis protein PilP [Arsenophonus nasoniae]